MVKALGVYFGHDKKECEHLNWEDKIKSCINSINNWNKRNLTFFGKITVIKTLLLSRFTYLFQTCFTPKDIISMINKIFYGFLWSNKREKITRKITICSKENGGLDMIHIESFIKAIETSLCY